MISKGDAHQRCGWVSTARPIAVPQKNNGHRCLNNRAATGIRLGAAIDNLRLKLLRREVLANQVQDRPGRSPSAAVAFDLRRNQPDRAH